uniref:Uncharacterized protein n=1 Tax=Sphaerodactylus townsendi TaxID=933632 RepID=A0ACB8E6J5_9SAUR
MDSDVSLQGDLAALPAIEEDEGLLNLGASRPGLPSLYTAEEEDVLDEPPDPPEATSSRHGDVETLDKDLDALTLHAQHEALQRAKRDWQQAREALIDDRVYQRLQIHQQFEREREAPGTLMDRQHNRPNANNSNENARRWKDNEPPFYVRKGNLLP